MTSQPSLLQQEPSSVPPQSIAPPPSPLSAMLWSSTPPLQPEVGSSPPTATMSSSLSSESELIQEQLQLQLQLQRQEVHQLQLQHETTIHQVHEQYRENLWDLSQAHESQLAELQGRQPPASPFERARSGSVSSVLSAIYGDQEPCLDGSVSPQQLLERQLPPLQQCQPPPPRQHQPQLPDLLWGSHHAKGGGMVSSETQNEASTQFGGARRCSNCETQNTPVWRKSLDNLDLCNACGLHLQVPGSPRPKSAGNSPFKKRALRHTKEIMSSFQQGDGRN